MEKTIMLTFLTEDEYGHAGPDVKAPDWDAAIIALEYWMAIGKVEPGYVIIGELVARYDCPWLN
jgi:hypothetical protein